MDIEKLIDRLGENTDCWTDKVHGYADLRLEAATAITDLLARAEAAEKELSECREKNAGLALALLTEQPPNEDCLGIQEWKEVKNRVKAAEARAEKAERERDAAINQIHGFCKACKNYTTDQNEDPCATCKHEYFVYKNIYASDNWEWNGGKKEE